MKKVFAIIVLALLVVSVYAQERVTLPLTGWRYEDGKRWNHAVGDTLSGAGIDTIDIGITGMGELSPVAVTISVKMTDADVSATPDSARVRYMIGVLGQYGNWVTATTYDSVNVLSTGAPQAGNPFIRTFVLTTDGENAVEKNAGTGIINHADAIRLIFSQVTNDTDSIAVKVNAIGTYVK